MASSHGTNPATTELIVALDFSDASRALELVRALRSLPVIYKVGSELFLTAGPDFVRELVRGGSRVFLDLKFHDIPNTVGKSARQATALGVDMFTLHLSGGSAMVRAAALALGEIHGKKPRILGVSVLTSLDDELWGDVTSAIAGARVSVEQSVESLVRSAESWGIDGVVCSAREVGAIRREHPSLSAVVPGVSPGGTQAGDQSRVATPEEASAAGASAIVVGRPVIQASDPREAARAILDSLSSARPKR